MFLFSISCNSIYYRIESDIPVKTYYRLNLIRAFVFNFKHLQLLRDSIGHPSQRLLSFEFADSFCIQFRASRIIKWLNWTSKSKVIVVRICSELLFSISSVSIYYGTDSDIPVKSYCLLNLLRVTVLNFVRLDILQDSIRLSSKKLLSFEFCKSFYIQFRASWINKWLNRSSESKVNFVWICSELLFSILSV